MSTPPIRSFPTGNYRIYYRQEPNGVVTILYVRHALPEDFEPVWGHFPETPFFAPN
jgi:hypothetical protein